MLWIACAAVVIAAGFYALMPLFRESGGNLDLDLLSETELDRLLDRKAVIDRNLQDLQFEYRMGRLSDADFRQLEAGYKNESTAVLQSLDQLNASENLDEAIEKDISARKAKLHGTGSKRDREPRRCPSCGAVLTSPAKKFCADCGHRL
jgi:rRNA maturation endonuclease Nob1